MNEIIRAIKTEITETKNQLTKLENNLLNAYTEHFASIGIVNGTKVCVEWYSKKEYGIFDKFVLQYNSPRPIIYKIKKDGTAHATATVYCYKAEDMTKAQETT